MCAIAHLTESEFKMQVLNTLSISETVDQLGQIKAQIAQLEKQEKTLKSILTDSGEKSIEGSLFKASIIFTEGRESIDWKTIAEKLNPSYQLINAHKSTGNPFFTVRLSSL